MRIVMLEPWGREFLLALDEKLEISARADSPEPDLRLVESNNRTLVFVEGCSGVCVIKDGMTSNLAQEAIVVTHVPQLVPRQSAPDAMWDRDLDG
jgi:hypothetical protein